MHLIFCPSCFVIYFVYEIKNCDHKQDGEKWNKYAEK